MRPVKPAVLPSIGQIRWNHSVGIGEFIVWIKQRVRKATERNYLIATKKYQEVGAIGGTNRVDGSLIESRIFSFDWPEPLHFCHRRFIKQHQTSFNVS